MASHFDYVEYVVEQLRGAGNVRARKMFGEYGLFCDGTLSLLSSAMTSCLSKSHPRRSSLSRPAKRPRPMKEPAIPL